MNQAGGNQKTNQPRSARGGPAFVLSTAVERLRRLVEERLLAYELDGNPRHAAAAWRALREAGAQPTERVLCLIDSLLDALSKSRVCRGRGARRESATLRDVAMLDVLRQQLGGVDIPPVLPAGVVEVVADHFRINRPAAHMAVSRLRRRLAQRVLPA